MKWRREFLRLESEDMSRDEAEEKYHDEIKKCEEFKKNTEKEREKELLELHPSEIIGNAENSTKRRKRQLEQKNPSVDSVLLIF